MRLNSKTALIYLFFTIVVFSLGGIFAMKYVENRIEKELVHRFEHSEKKVTRHIEKEFCPHIRNPFISIQILDSNKVVQRSETSKDTIFIHSETSEIVNVRQKTIVKNVDKYVYRITMHKSIQEYNDTKKFIVNGLIIIFLTLSLLTILFNILISNYFWRPFFRILNHMKSYSLNRFTPKITQITSTREFKSMGRYYNEMIDKIEGDYQNLKEYTENMSHEIQTPLAIIRNKAEKLMSNELVLKQHNEEISAIYEEVNQLSNLSNTLNLITKIENSEFSNIQEIQSKATVLNHISRIKELAELKNISFQEKLSEVHNVKIDPLLFDILLKNLIKNAVRYSNPDSKIFIESNDKELIFRNQGTAIACNQDEIFNRFVKADPNSKSLGLGLAIVKKICDLNNLEIAYYFEQGVHSFIVKSS